MSDPMSVSRRLVAVFAADVEGYSRLMGADEVGTLKGLTERRAILDRIIVEHRRIGNAGLLPTVLIPPANVRVWAAVL
jgi:adenylate cyclase